MFVVVCPEPACRGCLHVGDAVEADTADVHGRVQAGSRAANGGATRARGQRAADRARLGRAARAAECVGASARGAGGAPLADVFPGQGRLPSEQDEVRRLEREVKRLAQENTFLKGLPGNLG